MNKRSIGSYYEEAVACYLIEHNIEITSRNYVCGRIGEVDMIGMDRGTEYGDTLVFFEIKYRKNNVYGAPMEAVNTKKKNKIRRCAEWYLFKNNWIGRVRFDVVSVCGEEVTWIKNAF